MKIAVIGSGISGLSSALFLNSTHEVHLFESEERLGGHAHTVFVNSNETEKLPIDTGFLVYNTLTYPHFTKLLDYLGVETVESNMTLSITTQNGLEWGGENFKTIFAQKKNLFSISFIKMLNEILKFNKMANENLSLSRQNNWTLQELINYRRHSTDFQTLYLLPMTGAIWSSSYAKALQFPAETFLTFCINHKLLQVNNRPTWRTIKGGSINYVRQIQARLKNVHLSTPILSVKKEQGKIKLITNKSEFEFDKVIFATHAPTTKKLLQEDFPTLAFELESCKVSSNNVKLHTDTNTMPKEKACWSAWNVQARDTTDDNKNISLTYYINKLQPLKTNTDYFVTLNSQENLNKVERTFQYDHPQFDFEMINLQKRLSKIQGKENIFFAGAWTRYGFHEDGILSAVNVAQLLGVEPPWK